MIKITVVEPEDRAWKRWRNDCLKATTRLISTFAFAARRAPGTDDILNLYKRKTIKERYFFADEGPFRGRCAYCETQVTHFGNPDIDHFRPKLGVTNERDLPVQVDYGWGQVNHWGYFWLAYHWENLLPACGGCNQASSIASEKIGKHNRFPVAGVHARFDEELASEEPLLINPIVDDPAEFLQVDTETGIIEARNGSLRGDMTIRVFGLNIRDTLRERRLGKVRQVKAMLVEVLHNRESRDRVMRDLLAMRNGASEYTLAVRAVLDEIAPTFRPLVRD